MRLEIAPEQLRGTVYGTGSFNLIICEGEAWQDWGGVNGGD